MVPDAADKSNVVSAAAYLLSRAKRMSFMTQRSDILEQFLLYFLTEMGL